MLPLILALQTTPAPPPTPSADDAKVAFPHPLITEVLFSVPGGKKGDANKDGVRSATGDEFIELVNPHDKAIELEGYRLADGTPEGQSRDEEPTTKDGNKDASKPDTKRDHESNQLTFTFPKLTLQPGEVVVVFNGFESRIPGPVGDSAKAAEKNDSFGGAYVFSMKAASSYQALSNQNDMVVLTAPAKSAGEEAQAIECVRWDFREQQPANTGRGKGNDKNKATPDQPQRPRDKHAPGEAQLTENLPNARNSVQRAGVGGAFTDHVDLDSTLFSPGVFGEKKAPTTPAPAAAPGEKKKPGKGPEGK